MVIVMIDTHKVMTNTNDAIKAAINEKIINDPMIIVCRTDREVMLCEQVLRVERGEESEILVDEEWVRVNDLDALYPNHEYRAKPKKELIVPWELIDESISEIEVLKDKRAFFIKDDCEIRIRHLAYYLKLDLEGIDLPVTVKRPEVK